LGHTVHYAVSVVAPEADAENFPGVKLTVRSDFNLDDLKVTPETCIIVSTQGEGDEEALYQAVNANAAYIGFVASKTKAQKVFEYLQEKGVTAQKLDRVRAPAGLALSARSPEEIAVSILAEIVQLRAAQAKLPATSKAARSALEVLKTEAKDLICGMMVDIAKARHKSEYQGSIFYFCCAGCKETFDRQPEKHRIG
jgi:xanthine dehydrogenase accessory factor